MNIPKTRRILADHLKNSNWVRYFLLLLTMTAFAVVLYPNIMITRQAYHVGDVVDRNIKAPKDFLIEDTHEAERKRLQARESVRTVYDLNLALLTHIRQRLEDAFQFMRSILKDKSIENDEAGGAEGLPGLTPSSEANVFERAWQHKGSFEKKLGIKVSKQAFTLMLKENFSQNIIEQVVGILEELFNNGVVASRETLLHESNRGIILRTVKDEDEQVVRNLSRFYDLDQAKAQIRRRIQPFGSFSAYPPVYKLVINLSQQLIQPNITLNRNETEKRKEAAADSVKPVFYKIKAGEMLMREGERVTAVQLLKLKALRYQHRQEKGYIRTAGILMMILIFFIVAYYLQINRQRHQPIKSNKDLLFITTLLILYCFVPNAGMTLFESLAANTPVDISDGSMFIGIPLASGAMTVCLFMGFNLSATFAVLISICTAIMFQGRLEIFVYFCLSSIMAAYWVKDCRERKVFVKTGAQLGGFNILLATAASIYMGEFSGSGLFWNWTFALLNGIGAGVITAGIVPLFETAFNYTTDISLLELANLERPLLKRLMMEAPGTYHHSMVVGTMVEAAASEIGANPLLAKVCGYYHDIGKIKKPLYYIENQARSENRHDKLAPSMSSLVLIAHVKEGVEIAKKYRLGEEIIDAVRQHHGTSIIRFFYEKAKKLRGEDAVKLEDFRYPGPLPQTREAGLVMLADVVEAASRTLENPTPSRIRGLVQTLINKIFTDGQLDNCELTLKDLHKIGESFNKILNGIHHHRIEYPEKNEINKTRNGKEKNGHSDKQSAAPNGNLAGKSETGRSDSLKRSGDA